MSKNNEMSFENAMINLEDSIAKMESGSLTLDESIEEFEKALGLIKICEKKLTVAKERVRILTESADGSISDHPFVQNEN